MNLPTVPGDVLVGAAAAGAAADARVWWACAASGFLYLFGLADNDIAGAKTDRGRPIPDGEISLTVARVARALCLLAAVLIAPFPSGWWPVALALAVSIVVYNRTKWWWLMGLCRGLNVLCGAALSLAPRALHLGPKAIGLAVLWWLYIALVTLYSEGEEADPAKKRRVGFLVGGIVYLQLAALLVFRNTTFLIVGAAMLVALRLMKKLLPEVSAS